MATTTPLLLITADPSQPLNALALRYAHAYLKNILNQEDTNSNKKLNVFFTATVPIPPTAYDGSQQIRSI